LAALDADPQHGLAGPSINQAWNEQRVFPRGGGTLDEVARTAAEATQRFGRTWRTLEPLYSLADFCYVVRREVTSVIGLADAGYGLGPCWEMDYNIRAARAGWKGVWAGAWTPGHFLNPAGWKRIPLSPCCPLARSLRIKMPSRLKRHERAGLKTYKVEGKRVIL